MKKMKCLFCGCERDFVDIKLADVLILSDSGNYEQSVKSYACVECGFVQLFDKEQVDKRLAENKKNEDYEKKFAKYHAEVNAIKKEIEVTQAIINDENQTVKAVKEAKEKLNELNNKLNNMSVPQRFNYDGKFVY